jgi:hypothetical protein
VRHEDHRRCVEAVHEEAGFFVDGEPERSAHASHTLAAQPGLGRREQGVKCPGVVLGLEQAEESGPVAVALLVQLIDLRADAPDRGVSSVGDPEAGTRVSEVRATAREMVAALEQERRNPRSIRGVECPGKADERTDAAAILDGDDVNVLHRPASVRLCGAGERARERGQRFAWSRSAAIGVSAIRASHG